MSDGGQVVEESEVENSSEDSRGMAGKFIAICSSSIFMIIGLAIYPGALRLSFWNETQGVCLQKALYQAEDESIPLSCSSSFAENGEFVHPGDLGFLSCALDEETFANYNKENIPGLDLMPPNLFSASGLGLKAKTEMVICKEKCIQSVCHYEHRRLSEQSRSDTGMENFEYKPLIQAGDGKVESFPESDTVSSTESETDSIPARRLRRDGGGVRCRKTCVEWSYSLDWSDTPGLPSILFNDPKKAKLICRSHNPQGPFHPAMGIPNQYANPGQVQVQGRAWRLNGNQTKAIPVDVPVNMTGTGSLLQSPQQPPLSWSEANTMVTGNQLHTCNIVHDTDKQLGCTRLSIWVSRPERVALLGKISRTPGLMSEEGWEVPADWLCSRQTVERVCPTSGLGASCGEIHSRDELFEVMQSEITLGVEIWMFRLLGFLLTWLGICCICQSITVCVHVSELIICAISCPCALSSSIFVAGVIWMVIRPLVAIPLLFLGCCFCAGAGFLLHACRQKGSREEGKNAASQEPLLADSD